MAKIKKQIKYSTYSLVHLTENDDVKAQVGSALGQVYDEASISWQYFKLNAGNLRHRKKLQKVSKFINMPS